MKHILLGILVFVAMPFMASAAYNDVTLTTSTIISVGGYSLNVSGSSAEITSIVVNSSNFTVTLDSGSSFQVTAVNGNQLSVNDTSLVSRNICGENVSSLTLLSPSSQATVTVTPSATLCNGTGGGGGGGSPAPAPVVVSSGGGGGSPVPATQPTATPSIPQVASTPVLPVVSSPTVSLAPIVFSVKVAYEKTSPDTILLQKILNGDTDTRIAITGVGSSGKETNYFGPATLKALKKFQVKYGIAKPGQAGYGNFGPKTRAKMSEIGRSLGF